MGPLCECRDCSPGWCNGKNPAIYTIKRGGKTMMVCSRCILSSDNDRQIIPDINLDEAIDGAKNYDEIDLLCIAADARNKL